MLATRMGLSEEEAPNLSGDELSFGSEVLFERAFEAGPNDPASASVLLGCAILAKGHETKDGRLKSSLLLLARLVARADAERTLGPKGRATRDELMPVGWKETCSSWQRLRYAWREGLVDLLEPQASEAPTIETLDELTRMHSNEPEPVAVNIQEVFPSPWISFGISVTGILISVRLMFRDWQKDSGRRRR